MMLLEELQELGKRALSKEKDLAERINHIRAFMSEHPEMN